MIRPQKALGFPTKRLALSALVTCLPLALAALAQQAQQSQQAEQKNDGEWIMAAKNYANTRFSALDQINTGNAKNLKAAWTFSTGVLHGHEAAPLVVNNTMYIVTPWPNYLYALDLTKPGAPMKWVYKPNPSAASQGEACCDSVNRGAAFYDGRIYYNTLDDHTVAVDAQSGQEVWKTKVGDINHGETLTMAPVVVKGKVLVGNSGGEFGIRGWLTALDAKTGKIAWRAYHTGTDQDVLIGPNFKPYYQSDRGKDLGVKTWPPGAWKVGGSGVWGWISYDPELDLIYYGTANAGPWNADQRTGDNKWGSTLFARRPETGEAIWAYQLSPHDEWDYDSINEMVLLDLPINGTIRKVIVHPGRNGRMYIIDRTNGQVLSAEAYTPVNTTKYIDLKTGRPVENNEKKPGQGKTVRDICPAAPGGKDWQPSAWSPRTNLLYVPHQLLCMEWQGMEANYIAGTPYIGAKVRMYGAPGGYRGEMLAWDPVKAKPAWSIKEKFPVWSGALVTAGDVVFYGTMDNWFKAVNARTGQVLWQYHVGSGIIGQPITYRGPDGKQYVAILSGVGGWAGGIAAMGFSSRDGTGSNGFNNAMADLPNYTTAGGMLYVFALP